MSHARQNPNGRTLACQSTDWFRAGTKAPLMLCLYVVIVLLLFLYIWLLDLKCLGSTFLSKLIGDSQKRWKYSISDSFSGIFHGQKQKILCVKGEKRRGRRENKSEVTTREIFYLPRGWDDNYPVGVRYYLPQSCLIKIRCWFCPWYIDVMLDWIEDWETRDNVRVSYILLHSCLVRDPTDETSFVAHIPN